MMKSVSACMALVASLMCCGWCRAQEFPLKYTFDKSTEKWANQSPLDEKSISEWTDSCGRTGGGIHLKGSDADPDQMRMWRKVIFKAPEGKTVRVSVWARGKGVENVVLLAVQAHATVDHDVNAFATTQLTTPLKGDFEWTRLETEIEIPEKNQSVQVLLMLVGNGEAWFDDADAIVVGETPEIRPGIFLARGGFNLTTQPDSDAKLLLPVPLSYREQTPLSYAITCDPPGRMKGVRLYEDKPGNWIAELTVLAGPTSDPVKVAWQSLVLVGPSVFADVPTKAPLPETWPKEAAAWLASTRCVQSSDEQIRAVASKSKDVMEVIGETLVNARKIFNEQEGRCTALDAVQALKKEGSCTSRANLVVALLRASGVPARILAGYPSWAGPHQTHYIVEAYVPSYGWYPIESTKLKAPLARHEQIEVSIVPPEYEDQSFGRPLIANGVPFLSLTERGEGSGSYMMVGNLKPDTLGCDHESIPVRNLPIGEPLEHWEHLRSLAAERWSSWLAGKPQAGAGEKLSYGLTREAVEKISMDGLRELLTEKDGARDR